jgi:NDP-sugar pyrophosphorylase family protein
VSGGQCAFWRRKSHNISQEESILGTAGGVAKVGRSLRVESLVLVNGDIAGQLPVRQLLKQAGPHLSLAVTQRPIGLGTVGFDQAGKVVRLRGEVFGVEFASGDYMGLAHLGDECLRAMPERGCLIGDFALPELRAGGVVRAVAVESSFIDVGSITSYWQANLRCIEQVGASIVAADVVIPPQIAVHRSVIGEGASITGAGAIDECVVWPGAQVEAPLRRAIVLSDGQVITLRDEDC